VQRWVDITFDCLPLRSVTRLDVPLDASPGHRALVQRVKAAIKKHAAHNSYYLYRARCVYRLSNDDRVGMLEYRFEGTVMTDTDDRRADRADLQVELLSETCPWLTEPVVKWFEHTVPRSVLVEFDRFIEAGDLQQTQQRIEKLQSAADEAGGFLGMGL